MNFQKTNNITGWVVFFIALVSYWLTMEETASYWDCGEFIAVSYKLEVPHPPGAPLFLLIGRLFSFLSFGDVTKVAYWINFSSILASAFAALFLFWSITLFGRKLLKTNGSEDAKEEHTWTLMGAGVVGALAYTFCESAWFSAVEAEVYAMSSFFTAFVVWAMLKWEVIEDESKANRWLLLIFYMMGLSIGVHLLNLVTIPALALLYYFKKYKPTTWGIVWTMLLSLLIIFFINDIIIPGLPSVAGSFELFFVNSAGLPFGSGALFFAVILLGALVWGIIYTQRQSKVVLNTFLNAVAFILIGYASYAMVVIRSNYDTPINENDPSDVMSFVSYLKREQYGSRPLLYGPYFYAQPVDGKEGAPIYYKGKDKYEVKDRKFEYVYRPEDQTILPRIYSPDPDHIKIYRETLNLGPNEKPSFADNISFMLNHQIGWMYVRYFFFNFAGRESDIQNADWLKPSQWFEKLPSPLAENRAHNNFFLIPFILGLIGMFYQSVHNTKNFVVVALLFILTGVALVVYLNSPPTEPRERDYIYAGSYYAYCFWIGFAVIAIADSLAKLTKSVRTAGIVASLVGLTAPALMAQQGWDDHDRSNRFFSVDSAINYLQSCAPNAVLFTGGDNDTFPLWYAQEVEGVRTDVRVVVLSYYNTDWYIGQSTRQHYESKPFPYTLTAENYRQGGLNDYLPYQQTTITQMDLKKFLQLLKSDNKSLLHPSYGGSRNMLPTKEIILKVDVDKVKSLGIIPKGMDSLVVPEMHLRVKGSGLEKKDLAMLDLLATADWERPLYVNNTSLSQFNIDLSRYVVQEGNAYRILPVLNPRSFNQLELVNTDISFENMTKKFQFRNLDDPKVYYDEQYRNFVLNHRSSFNTLAEFLILEGDTAKAREALLHSLKKMPDQGVRYDYSNAQTVRLLFEVGEKEKALEIVNTMYPRAVEMADYLIAKQEYGRSLQINIVILSELQRSLYQSGEADLAKKIEESYNKYAEMFEKQMNRSDF
jgi:tetratricopeptide (TPR) repeat protein/MFS family permease